MLDCKFRDVPGTRTQDLKERLFLKALKAFSLHNLKSQNSKNISGVNKPIKLNPIIKGKKQESENKGLDLRL